MDPASVTPYALALLDDARGGSSSPIVTLRRSDGLETPLAGLDQLLARARNLVRDGGAVLIHSLDVTVSDDPAHRAYQRTLEQAGRYPGEIRMRFQYGDLVGPPCGWLHVDPRTLARMGRSHGWSCEVLLQHDTGEYLARLALAPFPGARA